MALRTIRPFTKTCLFCLIGSMPPGPRVTGTGSPDAFPRRGARGGAFLLSRVLVQQALLPSARLDRKAPGLGATRGPCQSFRGPQLRGRDRVGLGPCVTQSPRNHRDPRAGGTARRQLTDPPNLPEQPLPARRPRASQALPPSPGFAGLRLLNGNAGSKARIFSAWATRKFLGLNAALVHPGCLWHSGKGREGGRGGGRKKEEDKVQIH